MILLRKMIVS